MNKTDLIKKIKQLDNLSQDERAYLINLVNTKKKYGLVWEDKPEDVEEQLCTQLPVLREVVERHITASSSPLREERDPGTKSTQNLQTSLFETESVEQDISSSPPLEEGRDGASPNHILIEGDNLHALTALTFTHESKIDVIYIDPPYNTGNKDFKYNDSFVDREDSYRHSKWLSFMDKRLRIAKRLLSDKGVIFISIDDNEQAQLKLLCDEVLGEENFIDNIIWEKNYAPRNDAKYFSAAHDFIVVYKKGDWERKLDERNEKSNAMYRYDDNDGRGLYRTDNVLVKTFNQSSVFPVTNPNTNKEYLPPQGSCWRYSKETYYRMIDENRIYWGKDGKGAPQAKRYLNEVKQGTVPQTIWKYTDVGHTQDGKNELKDFELTNRAFETPKPSRLLKKIISYDLRKGAIVLDFFAGSGTTLQATMQLNAEDGGTRQCILVTNNENNICEEVTYERNRKVIQGYTNSKGVAVPGLTNNNLRYYQCDFVGRQPSLKNKRKLTCLATELLCIKEDCYEEQPLPFKQARLFANCKTQLLVIYDDHVIPDAVEFIKTQVNGIIIKVYVFSMGSDPYAEDFYEVSDKVELCALPDAIYKAYRDVLPKNKRHALVVEDEKIEDESVNQKNNDWQN